MNCEIGRFRPVLLFYLVSLHGRVRECPPLVSWQQLYSSRKPLAVSFQLSLSTESVSAAYPDEPLFVAPDATVSEVLRLLRAQHSGCVLICDCDGSSCSRLLGIFTERDALKWMASGEDLDQPISAAMTTDPTTVQADMTVGDTIRQMSEGHYRHLPILNAEGTPTGMATVYGIVHYLVEHFPQTIYTLPPKPRSAPGAREGA